MKTKLILTLTLLSLLGFNALAVNPGPTATTSLQVGHYYRIHSVSGDRYMCLTEQETSNGSLTSSSDGRKQPIIFIKKEKALTSPGTIFKLDDITENGVYKFVCQGEDVNNYMNGKNIGYSRPQSPLLVTYYSGYVFTNSTFDVSAKDAATSKSMYIRTKSGLANTGLTSRDGYLQDEGSSSLQATYLSIGGSKQASCEFYFEEVDGEGEDAYLGLPLNDSDRIDEDDNDNRFGKKYNITCTYYTNEEMTQTGSVSGSGIYGITDTQHNTVDDSYYTSVCFSFPVIVPGNVNCFFIKEGAEGRGEAVGVDFAEQRPSRWDDNINVMPAGIPFIVQTATNNPLLYKFIPLKPGGFATEQNPTNLNDNRLNKANTYFVNTANTNRVTNTGLLSVNTDGDVLYPESPLLAADELTDGNRAYYGEVSEIIENLAEEVELVDLIYQKEENGVADKYTEENFVSIADDLVVGYVNKTAGIVFAHDLQNNKDYDFLQSIEDTPENYFNFNPDGSEILYPSAYNQSNWVAISAPNECSNFEVGKIIPANSVTGYINNDKKNPWFRLFSAPESTTVNPGHGNNDGENKYSIAHLAATNHLLEAHSEHYDGVKFWFMQPRAMEVATIVWAILKYDETSGVIYAYVPKRNGSQNDLCFKGKVGIDMLFYDGVIPTEEQLRAWDGQPFSFQAVIIKNPAVTNSSIHVLGYEVEEDTPLSTNYIICPLEITDENIVTTAIDEKTIDSLLGKVAKEVRYYNLQGIESSKPFDGVNIVVITYDDGSRSSMKMIK